MVDLREECIEAGVEEILRWGIKPEKLPAGERHLAGLFFDRLLSVLADHADEWMEVSWEYPTMGVTNRLIEALKEEDA